MRIEEHKDIVEDLTELLGKVYQSVNWKKIRGRSAYDVFEHRLEVASYQNSIPAMLRKLCHGLSLQAPGRIDSELIERLDRSDVSLKLLRRWTQYFVYKAAEYSRANKRTKNEEGGNENVWIEKI